VVSEKELLFGMAFKMAGRFGQAQLWRLLVHSAVDQLGPEE
jgi:hypothetical protein